MTAVRLGPSPCQLSPKITVPYCQNLEPTKTSLVRLLNPTHPIPSLSAPANYFAQINPNILKTQYAVRGEIYLKAEAMRREGKDVVFTNSASRWGPSGAAAAGAEGRLQLSCDAGQPVTPQSGLSTPAHPPPKQQTTPPRRRPPVGNPHSLGAPPITFTRQVIALCAAPWLINDPKAAELFPSDAIERARGLLATFTGGVGAYTDSRGNAAIRREVADFIEARDGFPANPEVCLSGGGVSWGRFESPCGRGAGLQVQLHVPELAPSSTQATTNQPPTPHPPPTPSTSS